MRCPCLQHGAWLQSVPWASLRPPPVAGARARQQAAFRPRCTHRPVVALLHWSGSSAKGPTCDTCSTGLRAWRLRRRVRRTGRPPAAAAGAGSGAGGAARSGGALGAGVRRFMADQFLPLALLAGMAVGCAPRDCHHVTVSAPSPAPVCTGASYPGGRAVSWAAER